jgi:pimeloyl-ACP methyl ester carboxylesterase
MDHRTTTLTLDDGTSLHVDDCGSGEPLLLLHGLTGTGRDWAHAFDLDALAASYRWIAPDARGHGRSTNPTRTFTFARCAEDVCAILDHLGIARAKAIGICLGAKTLLHVATRAPERISAMVLVSATPRFPESTRSIFRAAAGTEHTPEEWTAMRAQHVHGDEAIAVLWRLPAKLADDSNDMQFTAERLATVSARTLVVAGDRDPFYPVELAVELFRGIPNASLCVVPGGGHGPIFGDERRLFEHRALAHLFGARAHRAVPPESPEA